MIRPDTRCGQFQGKEHEHCHFDKQGPSHYTEGLLYGVAVTRDVREREAILSRPGKSVTVEAMNRAVAKRAGRARVIGLDTNAIVR